MFIIYRMFVIHCKLVKHIACFFKFILCSANRLRVRRIHDSYNFYWQFDICFRFSIKIKNLCLSFDLRFVWNRFFVIKHFYECNENFFRVIKNRNDWFFRLDVFETIYDEKILHEKCQNRIWSIYSFWFNNCIQNNFTKYRLIQIIF